MYCTDPDWKIALWASIPVSALGINNGPAIEKKLLCALARDCVVDSWVDMLTVGNEVRVWPKSA